MCVCVCVFERERERGGVGSGEMGDNVEGTDDVIRAEAYSINISVLKAMPYII